MRQQSKASALFRVCAVALSMLAGCASPGTVDQPPTETMMRETVTGPFEVKLAPQADGEGISDPSIGRMSLDKAFHGPLEATSTGQMLGVRTGDNTSGGYVAMERVVGTLAGRAGSFVLQHSSTMNRGQATQSVMVVPDSGTGQLEGLVGTMTIDITDKGHFYRFEYGFEPGAKE